MPAPPPESLPAMVSASDAASRRQERLGVADRFPEHQQELERRNRPRASAASARPPRGRLDDRLRIDALVRRRPRAAAAGQEVDDAEAALRLERSRDVVAEASAISSGRAGSSIS